MTFDPTLMFQQRLDMTLNWGSVGFASEVGESQYHTEVI